MLKATRVLLLSCAVLTAGATLNAELLNGHATLYVEYCYPCYNFSNGTLKICAADAAGRPTSTCYQTITNGSGNFSFNVPYGNYFAYAWYDGDPYFGSSTYPHFKSGVASGTNTIWNFTVFPRTFPATNPRPAHTEANVNAPNYLLEWDAGIDAARNHPTWPLTYDIYASGFEYPELKVLSDVPCPTAWTENRCRLMVGNLQWETRYQWRIVSKLKSSLPVDGAGLDSSFTESSQIFRFSTGWDPASPPINILTANNRYFHAPDGGGSTLSATGTTNVRETQFKLRDENGPPLNAGDTVCIYTNRHYYLTVPNGSGTVNTNEWYSCGIFERWAYEPVSGGVAFRHTWSNLYMSATGGGGGSVTASASTVGPNETFRLQ